MAAGGLVIHAYRTFSAGCVKLEGDHGVNDIRARCVSDEGLPQLFGHSWPEVRNDTTSVHHTWWSFQQGIVEGMGEVQHGKVSDRLLHGRLGCFSERSPHIVVTLWVSNTSEVEHYNWLQFC